MSEIINIHLLLPTLTNKELMDGMRAYYKMWESPFSFGEKTGTILDRIISDYYEPLEGHRGFTVCSSAHTCISNEFCKRFINIVDSNTSEHNFIDGITILKQLGLNNI